ncbi:hypothetical protein V6N11_071927 [Hibiscus sabdariffa]|uniref:Secreted protein n=1 Tax=Hibiscus sabdariffa TaxID=183260 RepID=A0ABR2U1I5_9ROSI
MHRFALLPLFSFGYGQISHALQDCTTVDEAVNVGGREMRLEGMLGRLDGFFVDGKVRGVRWKTHGAMGMDVL